MRGVQILPEQQDPRDCLVSVWKHRPLTGWIQELSGAVHTLSRQILGLAQSPTLPWSAVKQVSPSARSVPLHTELLSVMLVQVYGLQHFQVRLYCLSSHSSPAFLSQSSVVVVVVVVVEVVVDVVVVVLVVVTVVVVVVVTVVVVVVTVLVVLVVVVVVVLVVVVVVVGSAEHFPDTQLSPWLVSHCPCLFPHKPFKGRGSEN